MSASVHGQAASQPETKALSERVTCSIAAAIKYAVPANLVLAVAELEGGKPGVWVLNRNGSYDVGAMQINTAYLRELARYGITPEDVAAAGCYAYELATWRLARHLARDQGDIWQRAANYHSRTPAHNAKYRAKLKVRGARWAKWLKERYATREFSAVTAPTDTPPPGGVSASAVHTKARRAAHRVVRRPSHRRREAAAPKPEAAPTRAKWVQTHEVHLSVDELRALHAGP